MTKRTKVPNTREAAERRILARQGARLDASCDHLVEATRVLIDKDPGMDKVATLAAHIIRGETDIHRVAQVAVRLAWRLTQRTATVESLEAELTEARALNATCTCGQTYETYAGPEPDCAVHGAVRALNEASREIESLKAELAELRRQIDEETAGS